MANKPGGTRRSFGNVRRLPSGRFQATYPGQDGVRRTGGGSFPTRTAAATWLEDVQADMRRGLWRRPELGAQRLDDYAIAWLTSRDDFKPRTRDLYARLLDLHILPTLGPTQLDQITAPLVREWHRELGSRTGPTARAQAYRLLRTVLNQAVRDLALAHNPCVIANGGTAKAAERVPATLAELDVIAAAVPARYRMLVLAGAWSGLRFGELTALRRRDVDMKKLAFSVTRGMHRVQGEWITTGPKSDAGRRTVHLPPHLRDGLVEHVDRFVGRSPDALVFATAAAHPWPDRIGHPPSPGPAPRPAATTCGSTTCATPAPHSRRRPVRQPRS
jgi:integrase